MLADPTWQNYNDKFSRNNDYEKFVSDKKSDFKGLVISFVIILLVKIKLDSFCSEAEAKHNSIVELPYVMTFLFPT